jgi:hypothetical protein
MRVYLWSGCVDIWVLVKHCEHIDKPLRICKEEHNDILDWCFNHESLQSFQKYGELWDIAFCLVHNFGKAKAFVDDRPRIVKLFCNFFKR